MRIKGYDWLRWRKPRPTDKEILVLVLEPAVWSTSTTGRWDNFHVLMFTDDGIRKEIFPAEVLECLWELMPSCEP